MSATAVADQRFSLLFELFDGHVRNVKLFVECTYQFVGDFLFNEYSAQDHDGEKQAHVYRHLGENNFVKPVRFVLLYLQQLYVVGKVSILETLHTNGDGDRHQLETNRPRLLYDRFSPKERMYLWYYNEYRNN